MDIKPLAIKSTIGLASLGGLGVGGYYGINALNSDTGIQKKEPKTPSVEEILKDEGYTLLSENAENNDTWSLILNSYKEVIKRQKDLEFENFTGEEPTDTSTTAVSTLKQKCKKITGQISNNEESLKKARKWCITPVKISKQLSGKGFVALKTNVDQVDEEKEKWIKNLEAYRKAKKDNPSIEQFIENVGETSITPENIVAAKNKCKEYAEILSYTETFEKSLNNFESWCGNK